MTRNELEHKISTFQIIIIGFAIIIMIGTILLSLPVSSRSGRITSPECALFTATSAVCVTGLVIRGGLYQNPCGCQMSEKVVRV